MRIPAGKPAGRRAGVAYLLVMMYLSLFSVLAVGFCAASAASLRLAETDRAAADAQAAAESGLAFTRAELGMVRVNPAAADDELVAILVRELGSRMNGTATMNGREVAALGATLFLPGQGQWINFDRSTGACFSIQVTVNGSSVWAKVTGRGVNENISRAIQLRFEPRRQHDDATSAPLVADEHTYSEVRP